MGFICARLRLARGEGLGRSVLNNPHLYSQTLKIKQLLKFIPLFICDR